MDVYSRAVLFITENKESIKKHLVVYFLILALLAPFVFMFRYEIYSTLLVRHDDWYEYTQDNGIPVAAYGYQDGVFVGEHETPRIVANAAMKYHKQMMAGNSTAEVYFNNTIEWLVGNLSVFSIPTENGTIEIAHWIFDFSIWDLPAGWYQAMSDAKALHALALAYNLTGNEKYVDLFESVIQSFEISTALGGNAYTLEDGTIWYPEYIVPKHLDSSYEPRLVLNGFLIGLANLYEANQIINSTRLTKVFNRGIISAAANLHKYDSDYNWTLYHLDQPMKLANNNYHRIHIDLTSRLYEYTNVSIFQFYSEKWRQYDSRPLFTWEELTSWEFISNGLVMVGIILGPLVLIDIGSTLIRRKLKERRN